MPILRQELNSQRREAMLGRIMEQLRAKANVQDLEILTLEDLGLHVEPVADPAAVE